MLVIRTRSLKIEYMATTKTILKRIAATSGAFRHMLARDCKKHSEAQCNGDYYYHEDRQKWVGYNRAAFTHHEGDFNAIKGEEREKSIIKRILAMTGTEKIPDFISYTQDVRGFVIKIMADDLTDDERGLCCTLGFAKDWGGDYAIIKDSEWSV